MTLVYTLGGFLAGVLLVLGLLAWRRSRGSVHTRQPRYDWDEASIRGFLLAGRFTSAEWQRMDDDTRTAVATVAARIDADRILALLGALTSEKAALGLSATLDGGESRERAVMGGALSATRDRIAAEAARRRADRMRGMEPVGGGPA